MTTTINMEALKDYLLDNMDEVRQIVSELNSWDGCLEHLAVYENDEEFFSMCFEGKPMEAVRAAQYGDYNYTDEYVRFNGYGNLESLGDYELEQDLKDSIDEIIENLIENQNHVDMSSELEEILEGEETTWTFDVIDLEVWGNEEEGWDVNSAHTIGTIELTDEEWEDDSEVIEKLVEVGLLTEDAARNFVEVDVLNWSETEVNIINSENNKPLYTIRKQRWL